MGTHLEASIHVREIFVEHANFLWRVLMRAGVQEADVQDALQEVLIIVSSKLDQFDEATKMTTWLYGIAIRVAANQRRKTHRKREDLVDRPDESIQSDEKDGPEQRVVRAEALAQLAELLESLSPDQRIVFELFELEEMTCPAIAARLSVPLGTVYTRLRAARAAIVARSQEIDGSKAGSSEARS